MHSLTTLFCAILTDLRGAIAHIAARDRAPFLNFLWPRISHTAQLFDLFERLVAEWRNGTLPNAGACHKSPTPAAAPSARRAPPNPPLPPAQPARLASRRASALAHHGAATSVPFEALLHDPFTIAVLAANTAVASIRMPSPPHPTLSKNPPASACRLTFYLFRFSIKHPPCRASPAPWRSGQTLRSHASRIRFSRETRHGRISQARA